MTAVDDDSTLEPGEWGVFVSRAVQGIRRELGEAAAIRVATLLHDQKAEAVEATRKQLAAARSMLDRTLEEVAEARRAHQRLQLDMARMEATVDDEQDDDAPESAADDMIDLRFEEIERRAAAITEREAELDEWETDLVEKAREIHRRAASLVSTLPPPAHNPGWGRRLRD